MTSEQLLKAKHLDGRILHLKMLREYLFCIFSEKPFCIEIKANFLKSGYTIPIGLYENSPMSATNKEDSGVVLKTIDKQIEHLQTQLDDL